MCHLKFIVVLISIHQVQSIFGPQHAVYNETEARILLNMAAAAYSSDPMGCIDRTLTLDEDQTMVKGFSVKCDQLNNPCSGYIVVSNISRRIAVVFRGTKTNSQLILQGWATLQPSTSFYGQGEVNLYFKSAHDISWPPVEEVLNDVNYRNYDVYITGHSLGGALAALAAVRTVSGGYRQNNQVKLVTFGEPRVGNLEFSKKFTDTILYSFRIVSGIDIVPHLPACDKDPNYVPIPEDDGSKPCDPFSTYGSYHHGLEVWYPDGMNEGAVYRVCNGFPTNEDFTCSNKPRVRFDDTTQAIFDHRHYFGVHVPEYGKGSCDPTMQFDDGPSSRGLIGIITSVFGKR